MANESKKQNLRIDDLVNNYDDLIESIKDQLAGIDEYFRKQCEEAKKNLNAMLAEAESQKAYWAGAMNNVFEAPAPTKRTRKRKPAEDTTEPAQEEVVEQPVEESEPEAVVDTIFPENNEPEEPVQETETVEPVTEEKAEETVIEDVWPEEQNTDEQTPENSPVVTGETETVDANEEWPEFPEDWK